MAEALPEPLKGPRREVRPPRIRGYEIEAVLGRGATGTVFRARQQAVERDVAIKVLHPELSNRPRIVQRLQREARTSAKLAHPGLVAAIDMGEVSGRWWYAMEFVDGPSLSLRLRQEGRLGTREALRIFIPLCEALEHLSEHGVVHRDIKPANILLDRKGRARLADLGLAFADDEPDLTRQGGTLGTPHYISPEQAVDPTAADVRSDIWSFGATLYHTVCGRPPFRGGSAAEVLSGVLHDRVPDPLELEASMPKGLALVLRKCLAREPENRYQAPRELLLDLERVRERRSPKVSPRALDPVEGERPSPLPKLAVGAVLLALGGAVVWGVMRPRSGAADPAVAALAIGHPALEAVAKRFEARPDSLASCLRELDALSEDLPPRHRERWTALRADLIGALHARVFALEDELEGELRGELDAQDITAAWQSLEEEFEPTFLRKIGFRPDELEAYGLSIGTWAAPLATRVVERTSEAVGELRNRLEAWRSELNAGTKERLAERRWKAAHQALRFEYEEIPAAAGFEGWRLPAEALEGELFEAKSQLTMLRLNVEDEWRIIDRGLAAWVVERADTLEGELQRRERRRGAAVELRASFAVELDQRRVRTEDVLREVSQNAWDRLKRRANGLERTEERLYEEELRGRMTVVERDASFYLRLREYEFVIGLWEDLGRALVSSGDPAETGGGWRAELLLRVELRQRETELLASFLDRACTGLRGLDGQTVNIWVGSILVRDAVLAVPADPLSDGFRIEGRSDPLSVRELRGSDLETFAGLTDGTMSTPEDRMELALFRFHDERAADARRALLSGQLDDRDPLLLDLRNRVLAAIEEQEAERRSVASQASELLRHTLETNQDAHAIDADLHRIRILLDRYGDVEEVRKRRGELLTLRERLIAQRGASIEERLKDSYRPDELTSRLDRVRLTYRFDDEVVEPWTSDAWRFDGVGWKLFTDATQWEDLIAQNGVNLTLREPLEIDTGAFELALTIEEPDSGPPQCLLITAAGFHIAFVGEAIPGGDGAGRWAVGVGDLATFAAGLAKGDGVAAERLLERGKKHEIVFRGFRASGRFELLLDGRKLESAFPSPPEASSREVTIRAWEGVRLLKAELEARQ